MTNLLETIQANVKLKTNFFLSIEEDTKIIIYPLTFKYHTHNIFILDLIVEHRENFLHTSWQEINLILDDLDTLIRKSSASTEFIELSWNSVQNLIVSKSAYKIYIEV